MKKIEYCEILLTQLNQGSILQITWFGIYLESSETIRNETMGINFMQAYYSSRSIIVSGFAQLPKGSTAYEAFKVVGVVLVIDPDTTQIIDADFTFVTTLSAKFLASIIVGYYLNQGIEPLLARIRERCFLSSQASIIQAVRACYIHYAEVSTRNN